MAESGVALAAARRAFVHRLAAACELGIGPFPAAGVSLVGDAEHWLDSRSALEAEDLFREALARSRVADRDAGRALTGPHRSDIEVVHLQKSRPAAGCSTGEEAYSLAIAFREAVEAMPSRAHCSLQIFATDLNADAIARARRGVYQGALRG